MIRFVVPFHRACLPAIFLVSAEPSAAAAAAAAGAMGRQFIVIQELGNCACAILTVRHTCYSGIPHPNAPNTIISYFIV